MVLGAGVLVAKGAQFTQGVQRVGTDDNAVRVAGRARIGKANNGVLGDRRIIQEVFNRVGVHENHFDVVLALMRYEGGASDPLAPSAGGKGEVGVGLEALVFVAVGVLIREHLNNGHGALGYTALLVVLFATFQLGGRHGGQADKGIASQLVQHGSNGIAGEGNVHLIGSFQSVLGRYCPWNTYILPNK